jgi:transmembrane sensor
MNSDEPTSGGGNDNIDTEAAQWFFLLRRPVVSPETRAAFQAWRLKSLKNAAAYDAIEALWRETGAVMPPTELESLKAEALAEERSNASGKRFSGRTGLRVAGLAFVATAAVVLATLVLPRQAQETAYVTGAGERTTMTLQDSSTVHMSPNTRLVARFAAGKRMLELESGRAFFEVQSDPSQPFIVRTRFGDVTAIGTSFDVDVGGALSVALLEGRLRISEERPGNHATILAPDQRYISSDGGRVEAIDADAYSAWRLGRLSFADTPLSTAIASYNQISGSRIVIGDPTLADLRISGTFGVENPRAFVEALVHALNLRVQDSQSGDIVLTDQRP